MPSAPAGLGTVPSHPPLLQDCVPGPGTYGPGGNPYTRLEERDKRSAGTRGLMDSGTAKCVLPAAMASPAPLPGDTLVGWPCPTLSAAPVTFLHPSGQRPGTWHLPPEEQHRCGAAAGAQPQPDLLRGQEKACWWGTSFLGGVLPWDHALDGVSQGAVALPTHCEKDASVPLEFCALTSL